MLICSKLIPVAFVRWLFLTRESNRPGYFFTKNHEEKGRKVMGKARITAFLLVGAITIASVLAGCTSASPDDSAQNSTEETTEKTTVELPILDGSLCGAPFYIAFEKGYFAEEGLDVKLIAADTETRKIGLNDGTYPVTNGDFMFFQSIEEGVNVSVVEGLHNGCIQILVPADSDIETAEDLRGASIGVDEIGGPPYEAASIWLENHGVSVSGSSAEVTFLPYTDGNLELQALYDGDIAAAAIWDPIASEAVKSGDAKSILNIGTDDIFADKYCCFVYASDKVLEENPEEIAAIVRALRKAEQFINENSEESVSIIAEGEYSEINDAELATELLTAYEYPTTEELEAGERNVKDTVEYFAEQLYAVGYLTTDVDTLMENLYAEVDVHAGE